MALLAQARIEANDTASVPPLVMVKREQVTDILSLLEPFEEALQVKDKVNENLINYGCNLIKQDKCIISNPIISKNLCINLSAVR